MNFIDIIILAVVALIIGLVLGYIHKSKKKGIKCIGCPEGAKCSGTCAGCSGQCSGCGSKE